MKNQDDWHDDDSFWMAFEPFMFSEHRWENTPQEVDLLLDLVSLNPGARICDMGCGPGRFTLELSRRGFGVTGVDRTNYFLENGRKRAAEEHLEVDFILDDMRSFVRPNNFDCTISMFTSYGYFKDPAENLAALENIYNSLREQGVLVIEMMGKEVLARIFLERGWDQVGDVYFLQDRRVSKDWSWMENRWILIDGEKRIEYDVSHWIWSAAEFRQILQGVGFRDVFFYGNLEGEPYDQNAPRMVVVAHK